MTGRGYLKKTLKPPPKFNTNVAADKSLQFLAEIAQKYLINPKLNWVN
jgi:hypothetical protein